MRNLFLTFEPIIVEVSSEQGSGWAGLVLGGRYLPRLKQVKSIRCIVHCAVAGPGCVVTSTGCLENCERNQLLLFFVGTLGHSDNCLVQQSRVTGGVYFELLLSV